MSYTSHMQQSRDAVQGSTNPPASGADDKRFTTAYGMVVWPTLPGLSSSSSAAPVASAGTPTKPECAGLVHHQPPSRAMAAAAAPTTAQTLLPETTVAYPNNIGGGEPLVGLCVIKQNIHTHDISRKWSRAWVGGSFPFHAHVYGTIYVSIVHMLPFFMYPRRPAVRHQNLLCGHLEVL